LLWQGWRRFLLAAGTLAIALAPPIAGVSSAASPGVICGSTVQEGPLPVWARAGFHGPRARVPHVLGRSGAIVAVLFGFPLEAPPPSNHNDKILWISRLSYTWQATLRISAQRMNRTQPVGAPVRMAIKGGPGPSLINLTTPGCWRLSLHWAGHTDSLDLQYRSRD
jgi:hypothetical protein